MPPNSRTSPAAQPTVAVVITTYNHARFLRQAIESVLRQSRPPQRIVVVDDGSGDDPGAVVARYPGVEIIHQENQGLSAARNTGLRAIDSDMVVFLDADDLLLPDAIASGLACHAANPGCALVYGGHRRIDEEGNVLLANIFLGISDRSFRDFLRRHHIGMHATVMYRRDKLAAIGGFDPGLRVCEDYDVYLRLSRNERVASHPTLVADYRIHGSNMSHDHRKMLAGVLLVHGRYRQAVRDRDEAKAWKQGERWWRNVYCGLAFGSARDAFRKGDLPRAASLAFNSFRLSPLHVLLGPARLGLRYGRRWLKAGLRVLGGDARGIGRVRMGDLARTTPIDGNFGWGRGMPIDRYYIERFLADRATDIRGRVLEIGDNAYTTRFGGQAVTRSDVLHVHAGNPAATIVGDLSVPGTLPAGAFDCAVITQTLHCIFDIGASIRELHAGLKPGGVLLVTLPCISQIDRHEWGGSWYWGVAPQAARRLFGDVFGAGNIEVESFGNVYAAITFLQGLALEEVSRQKLDVRDEAYPVVVTIRATKPLASPEPGGDR